MRGSSAALAALTLLATASTSSAYLNSSTPSQQLLFDDITIFKDRPEGCPKCPSCFNCNNEENTCTQFAACAKGPGKCICPEGYGGDDCSKPLCGSLSDGDDRSPPKEGEQCQCTEGWTGINCNVCETNQACNALMPIDDDGQRSGGVCYKQPQVVKQNYQMCDVTNQAILDQLDGKIPQVTFSCNATEETCNFQFWIDQRESFFCGLDTCSWTTEHTDTSNQTTYKCENAACECIRGRMLCGEKGSIDIGDFLSQSIKGPATFETLDTDGGSSKDGSRFSEPAMNQLISGVFGDENIFLKCNPGECMYHTAVPGYIKPVPRINTPLIAGVIAGCALFVVFATLLVYYLSRRSYSRRGVIYLDDSDDEGHRLLNDSHRAAALQFDNVSYNLNGKQILERVQGIAQPGQITAIMGASGAGKTTFLDILARKNKRGSVYGNFYINGEKVPDADFKSVTGFVDQEDTMLPTLTVHETISNSAFLRLPRDMSYSAKEQRVYEVERQLGIWHIKDQLIGSEEGKGRGVSGGERRRVAIACELVTSPSILFLDEPTSGLDAYNAYNVVECLLALARNSNRTVIFTIHQPRSNIVALFDSLVLLAKGRTVYSGPFSSCQEYFDGIGFPCPPGFNIADYLVDLTMHAGADESIREATRTDPTSIGRDGIRSIASSIRAVKSIPSASNISATTSSIADSAAPSRRPKNSRRESIKQKQDRKLYTRKPSSLVSPTAVDESGQAPMTPRSDDEGPADGQDSAMKLSRQEGNPPPQIMDDPDQLPPPASGLGAELEALVTNFATSDIAASITNEIQTSVREATAANGNSNGDGAATNVSNGNVQPKSPVVKGYARIGYFRQFIILSGRTWKNLHRNPMLMLSHYAISILIAVLCGYLYYGLTSDIKGFQNRLGLLFFVLALLGFGSLTSLPAFAGERLLFMRERANGYYSPVTYFAAKVVFDLVPLRIIPPIILSVIIYPMTGLTPKWPEFLIFVLVLVLFNLAAALICLFIGIVCKDGSLANLVGSLVMLFSLLFAGLLLNYEAMPVFAQWIQKLSIFHYGLEALMVNEVSKRRLIDHKYGVDIEVQGAAILSSFGFNTLALWPDVLGLGIFSAALLLLGYGAMHVLLVEKR